MERDTDADALIGLAQFGHLTWNLDALWKQVPNSFASFWTECNGGAGVRAVFTPDAEDPRIVDPCSQQELDSDAKFGLRLRLVHCGCHPT